MPSTAPRTIPTTNQSKDTPIMMTSFAGINKPRSYQNIKRPDVGQNKVIPDIDPIYDLVEEPA